MALAYFVMWDVFPPLSTLPDRLWLLICGLSALGMMLDERK
jgi:hypothetical protein